MYSLKPRKVEKRLIVISLALIRCAGAKRNVGLHKINSSTEMEVGGERSEKPKKRNLLEGEFRSNSFSKWYVPGCFLVLFFVFLGFI